MFVLAPAGKRLDAFVTEQVLAGAGTFALNYAAKDVTAARTDRRKSSVRISSRSRSASRSRRF